MVKLSTKRAEIVFVCLFVYLFVWSFFSSYSRIFQSFGDVTIDGKGLQILTYARHLWPLSSEGSLARHTYCDTGHPIIIIPEEPWHSHLTPSVWQWSCHYLFLRLGLSRLGFEHPTFRLRGQRSNPMRHHKSLRSFFHSNKWPDKSIFTNINVVFFQRLKC